MIKRALFRWELVGRHLVAQVVRQVEKGALAPSGEQPIGIFLVILGLGFLSNDLVERHHRCRVITRIVGGVSVILSEALGGITCDKAGHDDNFQK